MLAFRDMNAVRQLRAAGFTAFMASFLAMNCGEQEFNLLPLEQENGRGGSTGGGEDGNGGFHQGETGGASTGARASTGGRGPTGGAAGRGGMSSPPCIAPDCCTKREDCPDRRPYCLLDNVCHECYLSGDDGSTVGCGENEVCAWGYSCFPGCVTGPCPGKLKCAAPNSPCVECLTHEDCDNNEQRNFCVLNICVACRTDADCSSFKTCNQFNTCV
jgi:hypothetical protein